MLNPSLFHAARNEGIIGGEKDEEEGRPRKKARKYPGQRSIEGGNFQPPLLARAEKCRKCEGGGGGGGCAIYLSRDGKKRKLRAHVLPRHAHKGRLVVRPRIAGWIPAKID